MGMTEKYGKSRIYYYVSNYDRGSFSYHYLTQSVTILIDSYRFRTHLYLNFIFMSSSDIN